jgi:hypothetical protein
MTAYLIAPLSIIIFFWNHHYTYHLLGTVKNGALHDHVLTKYK